MSAASALDGACYAATAGNLHTETTEDDAESQEEEDVIIDIDGNDFVYDFNSQHFYSLYSQRSSNRRVVCLANGNLIVKSRT